THTKTALMLGLGETEAELEKTLGAIVDTGCSILVLGQYLRSASYGPEPIFIHPDIFALWEQRALRMGFKAVAASPMARSSYRASELYGTVTGSEGSFAPTTLSH